MTRSCVTHEITEMQIFFSKLPALCLWATWHLCILSIYNPLI